jgi:hypothetical protein
MRDPIFRNGWLFHLLLAWPRAKRRVFFLELLPGVGAICIPFDRLAYPSELAARMPTTEPGILISCDVAENRMTKRGLCRVIVI